MRPVLEILPENIDAGNCELICEVSNEGFSYLIKDLDANAFIAIAVYHFNTIIPVNHIPILQKIFEQQELLSGDYKDIYIIYSFPESVFVPFSLYDSNNNADVLNLIHGDFPQNEMILTDVLTHNKVYNCYRIPSEVILEINAMFPSGKAIHQYSVLMKNASADMNKLSVIFYPQKIVLTVGKEGKILLINSFYYKTAEDVSYTLLNVCRQFGIEKMHLEVSGLIEKDSNLYKEIYKYFDPVTFTGLPPGIHFSEEMNKYPAHFFGHFFAAGL